MKLLTILFTILFSTSVFAAANAHKAEDKNKKPAVEHTTEKADDKAEATTEEKAEEKK
jgi:hypothetical protein